MTLRRQATDALDRPRVLRATPASGNTSPWVLASLCIALAAAVLVAHWPVVTARAFFLDDGDYLHDNRLVRNPSWHSARTFLTEVLEPSTVPGYYQPVAMISLMLDYRLGGRPEDPRVFRVTSLALHVLNTLLVLLLLQRLFSGVWPAALAASLFGLHPTAVESISWLAERKTVLATFFGLLSLHAYLGFVRTPGWRRYGLCTVTLLLGLMSKPTVIPLPALMLLLDYWPLRRLTWGAVREKLPLFALAAAFAVVTVVSQARSGARLELPIERTPWTVLLTVCHNVVFYPLKLVWPVQLCPYYDFPHPMDLSQPMLRVGLIGTAILVGLVLVSWRWTRAAITGWLFFLVAIFPTLGLVGFTVTIAADRFVYLPMVGLLLPLTALLIWIGRWPIRTAGSRPLRATVCVLLVGMATGCAYATRHQLGYWQDRVGLMRYVVAQSPRPAAVHNQLAVALADQGNFEEAIAQFDEALRINPSHADAHANVGVVLFKLGKVDQAIEHWHRALRIDPQLAQVRYNLGLALVARNKPDQAAEQFRAALQVNRHHTQAHNSLGRLLFRQGRIGEAIDHYRQALQAEPAYESPRCNLAAALAEQGYFDEAVKQLRQVLRINPNNAEAYNNLGIIRVKQGQTAEAISHYRRALRIAPDYARAHNNLATALATQGSTHEAIEHYRKAISLDPGYVSARYNLAVLLTATNQLDEAIRQYRLVVQADPDLAEAQHDLGAALIARGRFEQGVGHLREALKRRPNDATILTRTAWVLATCPDPKIRDGEDAVRLARRACELSRYESPQALDSLAAAYAETGRFDDAVHAAHRAVELASKLQQDELASQIDARLKLYQAGRAYNQAP